MPVHLETGSGVYFIYFLQRSAGLHPLVLLLQLKAMSAIEIEKNISILAGCISVITVYTSKSIKPGKWQRGGLIILALLAKYAIKSKTNAS